MNEQDTIKWDIRFCLGNQIFITDRSILLDQRYVLPANLPPDGTEKKDARIKKKNYKNIRKILSIPVTRYFQFNELTSIDKGHYSFLDKIVLNHKYINFLLQRIPQKDLRFGLTGDERSPVHIYRGEEHIGVLMPFIVRPRPGVDLEERAEAGEAEAQYLWGFVCELQSVSDPADGALALSWYARAAEQGHVQAIVTLAEVFEEGRLVKRDLTKCLVLLERAIDLGCREAILSRKRLVEKMSSRQYRTATVSVARQLAPDGVPAIARLPDM